MPDSGKDWREYAKPENWHPATRPFPVMSEAEVAELAEDIKKHGLAHKVLLCDGKVLDGRNRVRACVKAEVEPEFRETSTSVDPDRVVWRENMERLHMTPDQRAMVVAAMRLPEIQEEHPRGRPAGKKKEPESGSLKTRALQVRDLAAKEAHVGKAKIDAAATVLRDDPSLVRAIIEGRASLPRPAGSRLPRPRPTGKPKPMKIKVSGEIVRVYRAIGDLGKHDDEDFELVSSNAIRLVKEETRSAILTLLRLYKLMRPALPLKEIEEDIAEIARDLGINLEDEEALVEVRQPEEPAGS